VPLSCSPITSSTAGAPRPRKPWRAPAGAMPSGTADLRLAFHLDQHLALEHAEDLVGGVGGNRWQMRRAERLRAGRRCW
jgi:hypothetical protein